MRGREVLPLVPPLHDDDWLQSARAPRLLAKSNVRLDGAPPPWFGSRTGEARGDAASPRSGPGLGTLTLRSPAVKYLNAYTGTVLLRCRKDSHRLLCSALPFVRQLESRNQRYPCALNTLHVGGTIRTCQKFLIQYNRRQLLTLLQNCTNEEERRCIQKSLLSCSLKEEQSHSGDEEDDGTETD
ncbi:ribonuclease P/MRP protein subunit POP5 isoform X1 [Heliangelus exortis]|uniref:ribonuclease P/MRP protein subunit POP5 isoform X1 n=1 Tax=Heliangelus exortis TaxID=472823 RepID=UPI003A8EBFF1